MTLPFTKDQFLDIFQQYNYSLGLAVLVLWLFTVGTIVFWLFSNRVNDKWLVVLLIIHWLWAGFLYHIFYFAHINPVAYLFGILFIIQAVLLYWFGIKNTRLRFVATLRGWSMIAIALVIYSLAYPFVGLALEFQYPRLATFGVPCATTLLTAGLLLTTAPPAPRSVLIIPIIWSFIGGSAAYLLHIYQDWLLLVAAILMLAFIAIPGAKIFSKSI